MDDMIMDLEDFKMKWTSATERLKRSGIDLNIPIVPQKNAGGYKEVRINERQQALLLLMDEYYQNPGNAKKQLAEAMGMKYATLAGKLNGQSSWSRDEIEKMCKAMSIPDKDKTKYFDEPEPVSSYELRTLLKEHYGAYRTTAKCAAEIGVSVPVLNKRLRGDGEWGAIKDRLCRILGIEEKDRERIFRVEQTDNDKLLQA